VLQRPDIEDEVIVRCLHENYGLRVRELAFLPVGGDLGTAVFRAETAGATYFCKLRRGALDETTVNLPRYLHDHGVSAIIAPLAALSGDLRVALDGFMLVVYPFVSGVEGYEVELSERQWAAFGAAVSRIHTAALPPRLREAIEVETYSAEWRERCRGVMALIETELFDDAIARQLVALLQANRGLILWALDRATQLAAVMAGRQVEDALCHTDMHPGNLLIAESGAIFIVDWDYPMLAPRERDLMFIGGGQGFMGTVAEQEERLFYAGYGPVAPDPVALTYYRYERGLTDITVESERILSPRLGRADREQALVYVGYSFGPGSTLAIARENDGRAATP
jgi:spectinomycin phosphotransferase